LKLIVAVDESGGIGKDGSIPWKCKEDLKFFKFVTMGYDVFMGRKTQDSLVSPLKGRRNFVITSDQDRVLPGFSWCDHDSLSLCEGFIIGGSSIYELALSKLSYRTGSKLVTELLVSRIKGEYECDTFFHLPHSYDKVSEFKLSDICTVERWI
jgi:dihydrofolate reductase